MLLQLFFQRRTNLWFTVVQHPIDFSHVLPVLRYPVNIRIAYSCSVLQNAIVQSNQKVESLSRPPSSLKSIGPMMSLEPLTCPILINDRIPGGVGDWR